MPTTLQLSTSTMYAWFVNQADMSLETCRFTESPVAFWADGWDPFFFAIDESDMFVKIYWRLREVETVSEEVAVNFGDMT